ncbi:tRNA 5-methoxyuridine(34)/uridine 5-oxyacetic acid(34) synthase CmoB [Helicobacter burdigaliensis]|uniref:tRNA 5-methoxyuridine(34)/uridine 5-oxyacetic acid(34) synthase CmoB n=1 Tax=Helicobacter burdigaliensis TaxID=2315334 RepID=UPI000EF65452|nr:tRNA 5-methoxyuridine(34)/uridine 5-oxyacetic acid(34) synthase CmoB [Helicobacter burdigaliensis]
MKLNSIKKTRESLLTHKHILPLLEELKKIETIPKEELMGVKFSLKEAIEIHLPHASRTTLELIESVARSLIPWRKGPFKINNLLIDSEWNSSIKYNLLAPHLNIENKVVADIGCNNGYYMLQMLAKEPLRIVGFDPMPLCKLQFDFITSLVGEVPLKFEMLGIEDLPFYGVEFDSVLCLGVLYHRKSPLDCIKLVFNSLKKGGEAIFDSIIIPGNELTCLFPKERYAKMPNVYFIPTLETFKNWLLRSGFKEVQHIATLKTGIEEQRKTEWSSKESLEDFLDSTKEKTIEGYPAPLRAYLKAKKL